MPALDMARRSRARLARVRARAFGRFERRQSFGAGSELMKDLRGVERPRSMRRCLPL
jgi:hypothetical protein